jgi:hypothetical protein
MKAMSGEYVEVIINNLNEPFLDFSIFNVFKLWQKVFVIQTNTIICEKDFQNKML